MKKKVVTALLILLSVAGIGSAVYFYLQFNKANTERDTLVQQNAVLQSTIDAIGPTTTAYTVAAPVSPRDIIHADDFVDILIPTANVTEDTVLDPSELEGKIYKVDIQPGTTMTKSLVMDEEYDETKYDKDLVFDYLPLGLKVGDYVNVMLTYPYGQTFVVIPHIRVDQIVVDSNVIKTHLNAAELELWKSARTEYALMHEKGLAIYLEKYREPGVDEASAFYPVISDMEAVVNANPNIEDASVCVNSTLRAQIDTMLSVINDEDGGKLNGGIGNEASAINSAVNSYVEESDKPNAANANDASSTTSTSDDTVNLEGDTTSTGSTLKTDADGNAANVTDEQRNESIGGSMFGDETTLE